MIITIPYIGRSLSVNYYKIIGKGGRKTNKTRPETEAWMGQLVQLVQEDAEFEEIAGGPVVVELYGRFLDSRSTPDLHNIHKVIGDALQVALGVNDRFIRFEDKGFGLGWPSPTLEITIRKY